MGRNASLPQLCWCLGHGHHVVPRPGLRLSAGHGCQVWAPCLGVVLRLVAFRLLLVRRGSRWSSLLSVLTPWHQALPLRKRNAHGTQATLGTETRWRCPSWPSISKALVSLYRRLPSSLLVVEALVSLYRWLSSSLLVVEALVSLYRWLSSSDSAALPPCASPVADCHCW